MFTVLNFFPFKSFSPLSCVYVSPFSLLYHWIGKLLFRLCFFSSARMMQQYLLFAELLAQGNRMRPSPERIAELRVLNLRS